MFYINTMLFLLQKKILKKKKLSKHRELSASVVDVSAILVLAQWYRRRQ